MKKEKRYRDTRFLPEHIQEAWSQVAAYAGKLDDRKLRSRFSTALKDETWTHDSESEFFADYRKDPRTATFMKSVEGASFELNVYTLPRETVVEVYAETRAQLEGVFEVFERYAGVAKLPPASEPEPRPTVYIGHGRDDAWRDLKDHLHEQHGYRIEAYEVGSRSGHAIRDILEDMLGKSSFALLVMTGEDATAEGLLRARQNVVHELGLFQGKLGFSRAIVLLEGETEEFSNIQGIHQIRFSKGSIRETFGDVLAVLKREFQVGQSA